MELPVWCWSSLVSQNIKISQWLQPFPEHPPMTFASLQVISQTSRLRGKCCSKTPAHWQKTTALWLSSKPQPRRLKMWRQPSPSWPGNCWHATARIWRRSSSETPLSWCWATAPTPSWAPGPRIRSADADVGRWHWFEVVSRETGDVCVYVWIFALLNCIYINFSVSQYCEMAVLQYRKNARLEDTFGVWLL